MKMFVDNNSRFLIFLLGSLVLQVLLFELGDFKARKQVPESEARKFVKIRLSKMYKPAVIKTKKPEKRRVKPVKKQVVKKPAIAKPKEPARKRAEPPPKPKQIVKPKELPKPKVAEKKSVLPEEAVKKEPVVEKKEPVAEPELLVKTEREVEKIRSLEPAVDPGPEPEPENDNTIALLKYRQVLISLIDKNKYYPKSLRRFKRMGRVDLRFSINSKGELLNVNILRKSRYKQFNRAAKEAVRRVGVFPPPPDGSISSNSLVYEVTILFELLKEHIYLTQKNRGESYE